MLQIGLDLVGAVHVAGNYQRRIAAVHEDVFPASFALGADSCAAQCDTCATEDRHIIAGIFCSSTAGNRTLIQRNITAGGVNIAAPILGSSTAGNLAVSSSQRSIAFQIDITAREIGRASCRERV